MCGIHAVITHDGVPSLSESLKSCLVNRGPDHLGQAQTNVTNTQGHAVSLAFTSTVLALRGDHVTAQPFQDPATTCVLCWNGEAWKLDGQPIEGNDGEEIFSRLLDAAGKPHSEDAVLDVLRTIDGPFSFIFLDKQSSRLYYGRDRLGRRSLLENRGSGLLLSSIAESTSPSWTEVEADGIYVLDLALYHRGAAAAPSRKPWVVHENADTVGNTFYPLRIVQLHAIVLLLTSFRFFTLGRSTCRLLPVSSLPSNPHHHPCSPFVTR